MSKSMSFKLTLASVTVIALLGLSVSASIAAPPQNDYFGNATTINVNSLPFGETVDITEASTENGEPQYCTYSTQTIWYKLTTTTGVWLGANPLGGSFSYGQALSVFQATGFGIFNLSFRGCTYNADSSAITFYAQPGTTYYIQLSAPCCYVNGQLHLSVAQVPAPLPVASFNFYPSDPSAFDAINFNDSSYDPGQVGIQSRTWNFGDGATDATCCPLHRYAADGDYTVQLTVQTIDGRTASISRLVMVRTHDVAITKFQEPQSGSAGQTRQVSVGITNTQYPEVVQVALYKSVPSSYQNFQLIGNLQNYVPIRSANRTTDFSFSYTFTPDDAIIGKVTFRAVASIVSARDALLGDNEVISLPTKVHGLGNAVPIQSPGDSSVLVAGAVATIRWTTPAGATGPAAIYSTLDDGTNWILEANGLANTGSYDWTVTHAQSNAARVAVVLGVGAGAVGGTSGLFSIQSTLGVGDKGALAFALHGAAPNPSLGVLRADFALRDAQPATLSLFDVSGRVMATREVGSLGPGRHMVTLAERLPAGLYVIRLSQGGRSLTTRAAVVR